MVFSLRGRSLLPAWRRKRPRDRKNRQARRGLARSSDPLMPGQIDPKRPRLLPSFPAQSSMARIMALWVAVLVLALGLGAASPGSAIARPATSSPAPTTIAPTSKADANAWTLGLAGGLLEGSFIRYAADIAKVLDDGDNLRVLPLVTYGAVGNVNDLLYLKGVDIAITQADVLDHFKTEAKIPGIANRIQYIAPLFNAEVHICAKPEFKSIQDLKGQKVAFNTRGSAANLTGQIVFRRLDVQVNPVFINNSVALEQMRNGDLAAVVHVVAKPNDIFVSLKGQPPCRFIPVDYSEAFSDLYVPTTLTSEDYPALVPRGGTIATIAVPAVLAVFNSPKGSDRYRKVARFTESFFAKFEQLQKPPFQPKWKEINLAGTVPGWTRYQAAEEVMTRINSEMGGSIQSKFDTFLSAQKELPQGRGLTAAERERLFKEFMRWQGR
jgi:TRAP-type uncharacterized transport system substrate-binding protein